MKSLMTLIAGLILSTQALATVDGQTIVYLVTQDGNSETYDVVGYQYTGCYGIEKGPQAAAFTEPFLVSAPRGCGGDSSWQEDVNALSCASSDVVWDDDYTYVKRIKLDLSKCEVFPGKETEFKIMVQKAAEKNFGRINISIK